MKTISVIIRQEGNEMIFSTEIESNKLTEISGTLSRRILKIADKQKKYKLNFGISFFRRFNIEFKIEGIETGENMILNQMFKTGITIQNNEKFIDFVHDEIFEMLTGDFMLEMDLTELKEERNN